MYPISSHLYGYGRGRWQIPPSTVRILHMLQVHMNDRLHLCGVEVNAMLSLRPSQRARFPVGFVPERARGVNRLFRGVDEGCIAYHTKDVYPRYIRMTNRDTGTPYAMHGEQTTKYGCKLKLRRRTEGRAAALDQIRPWISLCGQGGRGTPH